jgi:predicted XRE-type DNA-binding protein
MASKKRLARGSVKKRAMVEDEKLTAGIGNVFVDLGFDEAEAKVMAMRAEVMIQIELRLKARGWTQTEAAKQLGITQPPSRRSKKVRGKNLVWTRCLSLLAERG